MTPEEQYQDAVAASHEWRDSERAKPAKGEQLVVHWPNGPDFHMEFVEVDDFHGAPIHEGWLFLRGIVGYTEPNKWFPSQPIYRTLYAHPVAPATGDKPAQWEMLPKLL